MANEAAIASAIEDLNRQLVPNVTATAAKYNISQTTLRRRFKGEQVSRAEAASLYHKNITNAQEKMLIRYINDLPERCLPPTPSIVKNIVEEMTGSPIGINWVSRFCARYKNEIKSLYLRNIDQNRKVADNSHFFHIFFEQLREKIGKYHVLPENTYNFDEKGFLLGLLIMIKWTISIESLKSKRTLGALQDGKRDFISLLACICADGTAMDPALIYPGLSGDMQDTWLQDFDPSKEHAFFGVSENGWSNEEYGLRWLELFDKYSKAKAIPRGTSGGNQTKRLLILDGHSSHINMRFIDYADRNGILLAVLPPHSTHRLQPLDVGVFGPLSRAYSKHSEEFLRKGFGLLNVKKTDFWRLFYAAWRGAVTPENIFSGFAATGLHPLNPDRVLSKIQRPITPTGPNPQGPTLLANTPTTPRGLRGFGNWSATCTRIIKQTPPGLSKLCGQWRVWRLRMNA